MPRKGISRYYSRREFLDQARDTLLQLMIMGTSLQAPMLASCARKPATRPSQRSGRYLINIAGYGGWDSFWFHHGIALDDLAAVPGGAGSPRDFFQKYQLRYRDTDAGLFPGTRIKIGQALRTLYSDTDLKNLLLWRGMQQEGQHGVGNKVLMHGLNSGYAASYSSVVAQALARSSPRPLHYVQLSDTSNGISPGMLGGYAIPSNIGSMEIWRSITSGGAGELSSQDLNRLKNDTLNRLAAIGQETGMRLSDSKKRFQTYNSVFNDLMSLAGTHLVDSPEFQAIIGKYRDTLIAELTLHGPKLRIPTLNDRPLSDQPVSNSTLYDRLVASGGASRVVAGFSQTIFSYAMTEYLITRDKAAVVDLFTPIGDNHENNASDMLNCFVTFTCFRELVRALGAARFDATTSVLENTTLILQTEFDREPWLSTTAPGGTSPSPGTGHGYTVSVVMAGYGVKKGSVVGDMKMGSDAHAKYDGVELFHSLPIDPESGEPALGGKLISVKSVFPTICKIFETPVPANQRTEHSALDAVIDRKPDGSIG